jgi:hypothetical protein
MNNYLANWKTTVSGLLTAFFGFVAFSPGLFGKWPWVGQVAQYAMIGGLAALGVSAKDNNVTGGSKPNNTN